MIDWRKRSEWMQLLRYYQAGIVNTIFGYSLYAAFIFVGANMYLAQIASHILGAAFNYFTYSRYTFSDKSTSKWKFAASYVLNYLLGLGFLWLFSRFTSSAYLAGLLVVVVVSVINFVVLKKLVFTKAEIA